MSVGCALGGEPFVWSVVEVEGLLLPVSLFLILVREGLSVTSPCPVCPSPRSLLRLFVLGRIGLLVEGSVFGEFGGIFPGGFSCWMCLLGR